MGTFVEIQTDAFADNLVIAKDSRTFAGVRRPYRGIEIKEDTYAVIKVIKADGDEIPLTDAGGSIKPQSGSSSKAGSGVSGLRRTSLASTYNYSNFIIQRLEESRQEKSQILETFGDTFIFFFGERPRIINVTGLLMNTLDFNWRSEFWYNYENVLRGTKLVEQNARIYLYWDDLLIEGYVLQATARDDSELPYHVPFSMQIFVTNHTYLSQIGSDDYPITSAVNLQPLLRSKDVLSAKRALKQYAVQAEELISTTEEVRRAAEAAAIARESQSAQSFLSSPAGKRLIAGKNILANALILGLNAQNLTFLSIVNRFFKNRVMRFPKGIAGADAYAAGNYSIINQANPQRTKPLRTKIRDNVDEYVQGAVQPTVLDKDAIVQAELDQESNSKYELERKALTDLAELGIDPVQHPGGSPFSKSHALTALGFSPQDLAQFGG